MHTQHTSDAHANPSRWTDFSLAELTVTQHGLTMLASSVLERAAAGEIEPDLLESAVATYYQAAILIKGQDPEAALETANRIRAGAAPAARTQPGHAA